MIKLDYDGQLISFINSYRLGGSIYKDSTVDGCRLFWKMVSAILGCFILYSLAAILIIISIYAFTGWVQIINYLVLGYDSPWTAGLSKHSLGCLYAAGIITHLVVIGVFIKLFIINIFIPKLCNLSLFTTPKIIKDISSVTKGAYKGVKENYCPYIKIE